MHTRTHTHTKRDVLFSLPTSKPAVPWGTSNAGEAIKRQKLFSARTWFIWLKNETTNPTGILSLPPRAFSTGQRTGIDTRCDSSHRRMAQPCLLLPLSYGLFTLLFFSGKNVRSLACFFMFTVALPLNHQSEKKRDKSGWAFVKNFNHLRVLWMWWSVCEPDGWVKSWKENTGERLRGRWGEQGWRGVIHFIHIKSRGVKAPHRLCLSS